MCRSLSEGGRRCLCTDETRADAASNRRNSRRKRASFAAKVSDIYGPDARAAVMRARPRDLALITSYVETFDPDTAETLRRSVDGQFPGSHNMVMQDTRHEAVSADYDEDDNLRKDPMMVSQAMSSLVSMERAFLDSDASADLTAAERKHMEEGVKVRERGVELGLYDLRGTNPGNMTDDQAAFYRLNDPNTLARLGEVQGEVEASMKGKIYESVGVKATTREVYPLGRPVDLDGLDPEEQEKAKARQRREARATPAELAQRDDFERDGFVPVADGVVLTTGEDGSLVYRVDDKFNLPAKPNTRVSDAVAKIPRIEDFEYDPKAHAPDSQRSLYERMMSPNTPSGKQTREELSEAAVRAAYDADRPIGRGTSTNLPLHEYTRPGKSPKVTADVLTGVGHRKPGDVSPSTSVVEASNLHVRRAQHANEQYLTAMAESSAVPNRHTHSVDGIKRETSRRKRELVIDGERQGSVGGMKMWATDSTSSRRQGVADVRKKGMAKYEKGEIPSASDYSVAEPNWTANRLVSPGTNTITSTDVDELVAQANAAGKDVPLDAAHVADTAALVKVSSAYATNELTNRASAARNQPTATSTVESYATIPASADPAKVFRAGAGFDPEGYVSAGKNLPRPSAGDGERVVRYVYTTRSGLPVTEDRMILGPESRYRVAKTTTDADGTAVVHLVDDDLVLAAGQ